MKGYPPVRTKRDMELLWGGLNDGTIAFVASDHAPHTPEEKAQDIWSAPAGMVTVETMVPVIIDAVNRGKDQLEQACRSAVRGSGKDVRSLSCQGILGSGEQTRISP